MAGSNQPFFFKKFLYSSSLETHIDVWDFSFGLLKNIGALKHDNRVLSLDVSPDGKFLASVSDNTIWLWNLSSKITVWYYCSIN